MKRQGQKETKGTLPFNNKILKHFDLSTKFNPEFIEGLKTTHAHDFASSE